MHTLSPITILIHEWVTGGGLAGSALPDSWAAEGRAMRRALAGDFAAATRRPVRVVVTLDDRLGDDPGPWKIARIKQGAYPRRLLELSRACDYTLLIAPETDGVLANLSRLMDAHGLSSLGSSAEAIERTSDKCRLEAWLTLHKIPTTVSYRVEPGASLPAEFHYPAVLKPIDGAGSIETYYLENAGAFPVGTSIKNQSLLQHYIPGIPMSASFMVDGRGRAWPLGVGRQRMAIRAGRFEYRGGVIPVPCLEPLPTLRRAVESVTGLRGFVGIDFLWDSSKGRFTVLEINPRPTTSTVGLCRLLPPGTLAGAWLDSCCIDVVRTCSGACDNLFRHVQASPAVGFDAQGNFLEALEEPHAG